MNTIPTVEQTITDITNCINSTGCNISAIIADAESIVTAVPSIISDCASEMKAAVLKGIKAPKDVETCISDVENALPAIEQLVTDIQTGNVMNIISDVITLVPYVEEAATDCAGIVSEKIIESEITEGSASSCYNDAVAVYGDVYSIYEDIVNANTTGVVLAVIDAISDVTATIGACEGVKLIDLAEYVYANVLNL